MRVSITEKRWVEVRKSARDRLSKCSSEGLCVACMEPIDEGEKPIRGCHVACYHATRRAILAGKFTDAQRVEAGKLLEQQERGRKPSNPVSREAS
jgi:hypothetical protein